MHACLMTVPKESNSKLKAMLQPYWNTYLKAQTVTPIANMMTEEENKNKGCENVAFEIKFTFYSWSSSRTDRHTIQSLPYLSDNCVA